jgi:hypothetical protein
MNTTDEGWAVSTVSTAGTVRVAEFAAGHLRSARGASTARSPTLQRGVRHAIKPKTIRRGTAGGRVMWMW